MFNKKFGIKVNYVALKRVTSARDLGVMLDVKQKILPEKFEITLNCRRLVKFDHILKNKDILIT